MTNAHTVHSYLCGVNLSLDDVEDGDVTVAGLPLSSCGHHHILWLQEPPHHIEHCGFPHASNLRRDRMMDFSLNIRDNSMLDFSINLQTGQS